MPANSSHVLVRPVRQLCAYWHRPDKFNVFIFLAWKNSLGKDQFRLASWDMCVQFIISASRWKYPSYLNICSSNNSSIITFLFWTTRAKKPSLRRWKEKMWIEFPHSVIRRKPISPCWVRGWYCLGETVPKSFWSTRRQWPRSLCTSSAIHL